MTNLHIDTEEVIAKHLYREEILAQGIGSGYVSYELISYERKEAFLKQAREHLKKASVLVPVVSTFNIGDAVRKIKGYRFPGVVIGVAQKLDDRILYLVECTAPDCAGMCHIYSEKDLEHDEKEPEAGILSQIS